MRKYITPQTDAGSELCVHMLLCQSALASDGDIPDLVEDTYEW